jgi:hypothetical protein
MEAQEEVLDFQIEDVAALLATGYLRLCKARVKSQPAVPPTRQATGARPDGPTRAHLPGAASLASHEKGD